MSMIAKDTGSLSIEKLENGVYTAISSMLIDLGLQKSEKYGNVQRKFMIVWEILDEYIELNGEKIPRTITREYGFSLGSKSNLRKDLQAWRGRGFEEEELQGFNLLNILNKACQLQIILEEKNEKKYNNITAIMALPKGAKIEPLNETSHFDIEDMETWENWVKIPEWIQKKIKDANNYQSSGLEKYVIEMEEVLKEQEGKQEELDNGEPIIPKDDLPF